MHLQKYRSAVMLWGVLLTIHLPVVNFLSGQRKHGAQHDGLVTLKYVSIHKSLLLLGIELRFHVSRARILVTTLAELTCPLRPENMHTHTHEEPPLE
jgi:hypothetical protein